MLSSNYWDAGRYESITRSTGDTFPSFWIYLYLHVVASNMGGNRGWKFLFSVFISQIRVPDRHTAGPIILILAVRKRHSNRHQFQQTLLPEVEMF